MSSPHRASPVVEVTLERAVAEGRVLGHDEGGRVVLAGGGLPGERVRVALSQDRARLAIGDVVEVLAPSAGRVEAPCRYVAEGCGGCDLQHASLDCQREMKLEVLRDALSHLAGVSNVPVELGPAVRSTGYRTTLRMAVSGGRLGFRHRRSHDVVPVESCLVAHEGLQAVLADSCFEGAEEVMLRTSDATGDTIAVVDPRARGCRVPEGVRVLGTDEMRSRVRVHQFEEVGGHRLRVSPRSFFQSGPEGADALGAAVRRALEGFDQNRDRLADLYGGIGLFSVLLGARHAEIVERSGAAAADARCNSADLGARVQKVSVEKWRPVQAEAVVADPSRRGLGEGGAAAVAATGAHRVALVSCDAAAMGRDVALLATHGYRAVRVELVDQFAHTHHVEAVTTLRKDSTP